MHGLIQKTTLFQSLSFFLPVESIRLCFCFSFSVYHKHIYILSWAQDNFSITFSPSPIQAHHPTRNLSRLHFPNAQLLDPPTHAAPPTLTSLTARAAAGRDAQARSRKATCRWPQLHRIKDCKKRISLVQFLPIWGHNFFFFSLLCIFCRFDVLWVQN